MKICAWVYDIQRYIYYTIPVIAILLPSLLDPFTDWRSEVQTCSGNHSSSGLKGSNSKLKRSFCAKRHLSMVQSWEPAPSAPQKHWSWQKHMTLRLVVSGRSSVINEVVVENVVWFHQFRDLFEVAVLEIGQSFVTINISTRSLYFARDVKLPT